MHGQKKFQMMTKTCCTRKHCAYMKTLAKDHQRVTQSHLLQVKDGYSILREHIRITVIKACCYNCSILVGLLPCLIYKLNFIDTYV